MIEWQKIESGEIKTKYPFLLLDKRTNHIVCVNNHCDYIDISRYTIWAPANFIPEENWDRINNHNFKHEHILNREFDNIYEKLNELRKKIGGL